MTPLEIIELAVKEYQARGGIVRTILVSADVFPFGCPEAIAGIPVRAGLIRQPGIYVLAHLAINGSNTTSNR